MEASNALLFRSLFIGRLKNADILLHWSMWVLPLFILVRAFFLYSLDEALLQVALTVGLYACVVIHELTLLLIARRVGLGIRSITLNPIGGYTRLAEVSERPWKEIRMAIAGPASHLLIAGLISGGFVAFDLPLNPLFETAQPFLETFFNRLFWLNLLLAVLHIIPAFPLDGGRLFRASLALSARRLRATEVAALLSSFVALMFLIPGMVWMNSIWWLIAFGIVIHVCGQQELMSVRYFASIQQQIPGVELRSTVTLPVDQLLDEDARPDEPDFNGLTWNPKNRLWIVWRDGQPVSANALVGESEN